MRKAADQGVELQEADLQLQLLEKEQNLIKGIAKLPAVVKEAGDTYSPALLANYSYDLAKECAEAIKNAMGMLGSEMPDRM